MVLFFTLLGIFFVAFIVYRIFRDCLTVADSDGFSQAGIKVNYNEGTIRINGQTHEVSEVRHIEYTKKTPLISEVAIDVRGPRHIVYITCLANIGNSDKEFVIRLNTALRKAGANI